MRSLIKVPTFQKLATLKFLSANRAACSIPSSECLVWDWFWFWIWIWFQVWIWGQGSGSFGLSVLVSIPGDCSGCVLGSVFGVLGLFPGSVLGLFWVYFWGLLLGSASGVCFWGLLLGSVSGVCSGSVLGSVL